MKEKILDLFVLIEITFYFLMGFLNGHLSIRLVDSSVIIILVTVYVSWNYDVDLEWLLSLCGLLL